MTLQKEFINSVTDKVEEIQKYGYCILRGHFATALIDNCRAAFLPVLKSHLAKYGHQPNRGTNRHFLPMPFEPPCFAPEFFFDPEILSMVTGILGDRIIADQWGCDFPLSGSVYQGVHVDYQRPLFQELSNLRLPAYMLTVSYSLTKITQEDGPIELAPCTHDMPREEAIAAVEMSKIKMLPMLMDVGDVLIRHPWVLHRGTPNRVHSPRLLVTIRYVRNWYWDNSREVSSIPASVWESLSVEQRSMLRFPVQTIDQKNDK
ncbi:MAG: phytanoyl-CoA dioxygenase family protein [Chitinophagales bacterium]